MIYLGLGSNLGERREHISGALSLLAGQGVKLLHVAPCIESPPLLPQNAPDDWFKPFLNTVAAVETSLSPQQLLNLCKSIEQKIGRDMQAPRWSPRPIDIDILHYHDEKTATETLTLPHPGCNERTFVQTPLAMLTGQGTRPRLKGHQPLIMGILNLTPDSFSDGGLHTQSEILEQTIEQWVRAGVHIFDLGAESTRPNATQVEPEQEWQRLQPALNILKNHRQSPLRPWVSIDTRHPQTAEKAIHWGVDIINDVSGLSHPNMQRLIAESGVQAVAMHSLTVPADKTVTLPPQADVIAEIKIWLDKQLEDWQKANINPNRIIIDPGLGFGKTARQSLEILQRLDELAALPQRLLIGHSRKSFMNLWTQKPFAERDTQTLAISTQIAPKTDILRVHAAPEHIHALKAAQFCG